jgi:hypothetical protein
MRTTREAKNYIQKDFGFYDMCVPAAMGITPIAVYETIRRFVWRSEKYGARKLRDAFRGGRLVASIGQKRLAALLGVHVQTIRKAIGVLEDCRWIEISEAETGDQHVYVLGFIHPSYGELYWADEVCRDLMDFFEEHMAAKEIEKLSAISAETRRELTTSYLGRMKGNPLRSQTATLLPPGGEKVTAEGGEKVTLRTDVQGRKSHHNILTTTGNREPTSREKEYPLKGGVSLAGVHLPSEPCELESLTPTLVENEDQVPADAAPRHRPRTESDGVPLAVADAEGTPRKRTADFDAIIQRAKDKAGEQRDANLKRDSGRKRKRLNLEGKAGVSDSKFPRLVGDLQRSWTRDYKSRFPDMPLAEWAGKEKGQIAKLVEKYNGEQVGFGLTYIVTNWEKIAARFNRKAGVPTPGFLLTFHSDLIPEAVRWSRVADVQREYDAWIEENPGVWEIPEDLERRYQTVRSELEALKLV